MARRVSETFVANIAPRVLFQAGTKTFAVNPATHAKTKAIWHKKRATRGGSKVVSQGGVKKSGQEPLASKIGHRDNDRETLICG
jgi:hypothetical protein